MTGTMTETVLAAEEGGAAIHVGHHTMVFEMFGMTFNGDTILATAITAVIIIALAFVLKAKVTSTGVPSGIQLFWEALTIQMRQQIEGSIGMKVAPFVLPLAVALFAFILISNWLAVLPLQYGGSDGAAGELYKPPASDINSRSRCSCSSAITQRASGAAASSATRSRS
jgi:F-type H+-transporting ATPase subunit a